MKHGQCVMTIYSYIYGGGSPVQVNPPSKLTGIKEVQSGSKPPPHHRVVGCGQGALHIHIQRIIHEVFGFSAGVETTVNQWFSEPQGPRLFTPNQQGGKTKR